MICLFRSVPLVLGLWIAKWIETTIPFNVNQVLSALLFILYLPILSDQDWKSSNGLMCFDFPFVDMRNYSHCLHLAIQTMKHRDLVLAVATCSLCYTSLVEIFWWQTSCRSRARPGHTKYSPAQLADTSSARFTVRCQPSNYTGRRWRVGGATMKQQSLRLLLAKTSSVHTWDENALGLGRYLDAEVSSRFNYWQ